MDNLDTICADPTKHENSVLQHTQKQVDLATRDESLYQRAVGEAQIGTGGG